MWSERLCGQQPPKSARSSDQRCLLCATGGRSDRRRDCLPLERRPRPGCAGLLIEPGFAADAGWSAGLRGGAAAAGGERLNDATRGITQRQTFLGAWPFGISERDCAQVGSESAEALGTAAAALCGGEAGGWFTCVAAAQLGPSGSVGVWLRPASSQQEEEAVVVEWEVAELALAEVGAALHALG